MDGQDNQQQQQGLQSASQDTGTADSSLDWGPDVSYQWLVGIVGFSYADVCRVRADDPIDVFRLVAFHFEDASRSADSLAESIPDYVRCRRDDGLWGDAAWLWVVVGGWRLVVGGCRGLPLGCGWL